ncbi:lamin tail domain-containing protein 1 isoform X1 [Balaenoptera ricei]|uniref:lamin tail domain-containing protein 1 isoform X1 n=2 Tax=Balaenoptera ricei TaxID=2746895 RepID=UPI0028BE7451|nr:lamin tail domain-containing protein 1 isoform X1 [Balaenoptera ricei]XP_059791464.1 lamin tail domain-containing protein 1 isoform X1 [Balaenoptera ricei]XP_059791465.1 lamin tail domain-containing protein 1 isoform X1 [Balaenoptera ricei]XP_059791466.1 lamin tail domain-containing protein 1 isoform X1 [Balaenoptera ricei]XP_059791467.1 lamin tail domain-containing protein 1 isoform X1 [Balaenoptera ricei]XP_059791468.1 lamin tail domain-containing protein 1 isoform X1 [Balaenoptera ricei]
MQSTDEQKRKKTSLPAKMKDTQATQEISAVLQSEVHEQEDKMENQAQLEDTRDDLPKTQRSLVHFFPTSTDSDTTTLPCSQSLSNETPLSYYLSSPQDSGVTLSTIGPKPLKPALVNHSQSEDSLGLNNFKIPKKHTMPVLASQPAVIGEGEDYFLSLFGDSKKLVHSFHTKKIWKHFSMILEEVGQSRSSALGDIKIADVNVKGLCVKLINSSLDKELEIGNHILQQNVDGQTVSLYQFLPNIIMQANSTVTVWAAASEAKHQPPSDFLWKEQNRFRTSPNCTTILCKPNGEAVAWYTPIHWKQAWEKLETDIECDRCSVVSPTSQRHMFHWPAATTTTKEKQDQSKKDISKYQVERVRASLTREKEIPPTLFPNRSPWCHSPNVSAHPYCPLIDPHNTYMTERSLDRQPRSQSAKPDPARDQGKTGRLSYKSNRQSVQLLKDNNIQV